MFHNKFTFRFFFFLICVPFKGIPQTESPVAFHDSDIIHLADPTIFHNKGIYYLHGTVEGASGNGFLVYTSSDLKSWKLSNLNNGYALKKGNAFGTAGFWASQIFFYSDKYYMAYVANENVAIAESDSPLGPKTNKKPLPAPVKQIDPSYFGSACLTLKCTYVL